MEQALTARTCLGLLILMCCEAYAGRYEPLFFAMDQQCQRVAKREVVSRFAGQDLEQPHTLFLLSDEAGQPLLFYSEVNTPVCIDNVCKPVRIDLYWDLLGNYAGYGVPADSPLTKYDHVPFETWDYWRLHQVLSDRSSILGRRQLVDLFDPDTSREKTIVSYKGQVDAVSGATSKEVEQSVVPGALYSCYAIWHLVHGEVREQMVQQLQSRYSPALAHRFLYSEYPDYQVHAITEMDGTQIENDLPRALEIFRTAKPSARARVLESLPPSVWQRKCATEAIYRPFSELDVDLRTLVIQKLKHAHPVAAGVLVGQVENMTKNQLKAYLAYLSDDPSRMSDFVETELHRLVAAEHYAYCYVIESFLQDLK